MSMPNKPTPTNGKKFLLCIDDHSDVLAIMSEFLQASGYSVLTASSGHAGLKLLAEHRVDGVIVDYEMPRRMGDAVAKDIRRLHPDLPILMFSGYVPDIPSTAFDNVDVVVTKGERATELLRAIAGMFGPSQPRKPRTGQKLGGGNPSRKKPAARSATKIARRRTG